MLLMGCGPSVRGMDEKASKAKGRRDKMPPPPPLPCIDWVGLGWVMVAILRAEQD